jgi:hypothetical protein
LLHVVYKDPFGGSYPIGATANDLNRVLQGTGVTFTQVNELAKQNGITLLDSTGHLIPAAVGQFVEAMQAAVAAATHWTNTLTDQQTLMDTRRAVYGVSGNPAAALVDELALLKQQASALYQQYFGGVNIAGEAATLPGRDDLRKRLERLYEDMQRGLFGEGAWGGFDKTTLAQLLSTVGSELTALGDSASNAAKNLRDISVPQIFKRELAAFNARDPNMPGYGYGANAPVPPYGAPPPTPAGGWPWNRPGGGWLWGTAGGGTPSKSTQGGGTWVFSAGSIVIQGANKTAEQLLAELTEAARKKALARSRDSSYPYTKIQ